MRVLIIFYFLTFVLSATLSHASSSNRTTIHPADYDANKDEYLSTIPRSDFAPRREWDLGALVGFSGGNYLEDYSWPQGPDFTLRLERLTSSEESKFFTEVTLTSKEYFSVGLGKKFLINDRDIYAPYSVLSLNSYSEFDENLKGLFKMNRWRIRAGAGIGVRFNFEFGAGLAVNGPDLYARFGYKIRF